MALLPKLNALLTFRKSTGTDKEVPRLTADGKIRVETSSTVSPAVGSSPPASPSEGGLWFNNSADQNELYYYDDSRSFWLSTSSFAWQMGHDSADGTNLRGFGINNANNGTNIQLPLDAMITRIQMDNRAGNDAKTVELVSDGSGGTTILSSLVMAAGTYRDNAAAIEVNQNDEFWAQTNPAGAGTSDLACCFWFKWKVAPV